MKKQEAIRKEAELKEREKLKEEERSRQLWQEAQNDKKYLALCNKHYALHEEIESMYSVLYNLNIIDGDKVEIFIEKCYEDIELLKLLTVYWKKYESTLPTFSECHKRLSMIFEKQRDYEKAIEICVEAISLGYPDDGTKGKMYGRIARLIKKSGIIPSEELKSLLLSH